MNRRRPDIARQNKRWQNAGRHNQRCPDAVRHNLYCPDAERHNLHCPDAERHNLHCPDAVRLEGAVLEAYAIIGRSTPIKGDCGILCGAACCQDAGYGDDDEDCGLQTTSHQDTNDGQSVGRGFPDAPPETLSAFTSARQGCRALQDGFPVAEHYNDCGGETGGAGDSAAQGHLGMILFPGEEGLLSKEPGYRFFRIPYMGVQVWFLVCEGVCDRKKRPLACRIFPLAPYIGDGGSGFAPHTGDESRCVAPHAGDNGSGYAPHTGDNCAVCALPDPRAARMCPLAGGERLDPGFRRAVTKAFRHLAREPEMLEYMRLVSADLDEARNFISHFKKPHSVPRRDGRPRPSATDCNDNFK